MSDARIGKFDILSAIGAGGMADVYRCRLRGPGGFEKIVVVKRIRAERAADPCFVNMFLDEARLAARLNHPNIVQVFEIGEADGLPYIAMEYVKGPTLSALMRAARRAGQVPLGHVARVMADVCEGLQHAHSGAGPGRRTAGAGPPRRQPAEHPRVARGAGQAAGLRRGQGQRAPDRHAGRDAEGQAALHGPRAAVGRGRSPGRPVLGWRLPVRGDHRPEPVRPAHAGRGGPVPAASARASTGARRSWYPTIPRSSRPSCFRPSRPIPARRCASARELQDRLEQFASREPFQSGTRAVAEWVRQLFPDPDDRAPQATPLAAGPLGRPRRSSPFNPLAAVLSPDTSASAGGPGGQAARPAAAGPAAPHPTPGSGGHGGGAGRRWPSRAWSGR